MLNAKMKYVQVLYKKRVTSTLNLCKSFVFKKAVYLCQPLNKEFEKKLRLILISFRQLSAINQFVVDANINQIDAVATKIKRVPTLTSQFELNKSKILTHNADENTSSEDKVNFESVTDAFYDVVDNIN